VDLIEIEPGEKNILFAGNAYWCMGKKFKAKYNGTAYDNFYNWKKETGQEIILNKSYGLFSDPKLLISKSDNSIGDAHKLLNLRSYRLQPKSPLKKSGVDLRAINIAIPIPSRDFWGNPIPATGRLDIGAYQMSK